MAEINTDQGTVGRVTLSNYTAAVHNSTADSEITVRRRVVYGYLHCCYQYHCSTSYAVSWF